jgi:enolase
MAKIKKITAREILDSRGIPTIEGRLELDNNQVVFASSSSGESLGKYEAVELRDNDLTRYAGLGVTKAVAYINDLLGPKLVGVSPERQEDVDFWLIKADGSNNRAVLGTNTISVISQMLLKASALNGGVELYQYVLDYFNRIYKKKVTFERLPSPIFNIINGGKHGTKNLEFQEFQLIPSTAMKFRKSLEMAADIYSTLKNVLDYRNAGISVSEEGGFTPNLLTNNDALEIMKESLVQNKIQLGVDAFLGLDIAASQFMKNDKYALKDRPTPLTVSEYIQYLDELIKKYSLLVVEDPLNDEDFPNWHKLSEQIGVSTYLVGDDFIAGNKQRLVKAVAEKACSAIVLKFNQVATLSELFEVVNLAKEANIKLIVSQRLGETNDDIIADIAVGIQSEFVKFGAPVRGERVAKYNRLLKIEQDLHFQ